MAFLSVAGQGNDGVVREHRVTSVARERVPDVVGPAVAE
jgi:hypothetical protein